jgi:para-aminobenzoate synthetase component 1
MIRGEKNIIKKLNQLGKNKEPFVFIIDFEANNAIISSAKDNCDLLWQANDKKNFTDHNATPKNVNWNTTPINFKAYQKGYDLIQKHIHNGDTYLLNYTQPTCIETNLSLEEIFHKSSARYKILLKDKFVCFSPEIFVQIKNNKISSFPMKGTIDASIDNAKARLLNDTKETAEHNTIVDLIRNDLSLISDNVTVERFKYLERIKTNQQDLWQMSSKITGYLHENYTEKIGSILFKMLPAGSICGAPKNKTIEIIKDAETYNRGFYTGIFGHFDGNDLDSCVLIRYIENINGQLIYKSGGGITHLSKVKDEYYELLQKIYLPLK